MENNRPVSMIRHDLAGIPEFPLPPGHEIRGYSPGDERLWVSIQSAADRFNTITMPLYCRQFGNDPAALAERQFFLFDPEGRAIGTATAWFDDKRGAQGFGRVHWVALHPQSQGRGLSKPLLGKVCATLRKLGHRRACLTTSTARLAAIGLYLRFGFLPEIEGPDDAAIWRQVQKSVAQTQQRGSRGPETGFPSGRARDCGSQHKT